MKLYILFEHASGYLLFSVKEFEEVGAFQPQVEAAVMDAGKFLKVVNLASFKAHSNAAAALKNINAVSEGIITDDLTAFLEVNMPKGKKIHLGVSDPKLGAAIAETFSYNVTHTGVVPELIRGIRTHLGQFVKGLNAVSLKQTELGLGHSYSRSKVKFNVNKSDNMIIQSIALIDQLDKDINTFAMRMREWYSYHFPELIKIVPDNQQYARCANFINNRNSLTQESLEELEKITMSSAKATAILDAARMSMGMDISEMDLLNIKRFAKRVVALSDYRLTLAEYLRSKMSVVAPNLSTLIGEVVGARLISHAGSLTNLAKYPASTVQILGAEKALFRALKTRSNTPKYGLIYHSTFIGRAGTTNKGRVSRYLANKCSIASRIDCFSEIPTTIFGEKLRDQVEERLSFFETGAIPRKNAEVMSEALSEHQEEVKVIKKKEKKEKKKKTSESENAANDSVMSETMEETPVVKKKKKKRNADESMSEMNGEETSPKKKKHNESTNGELMNGSETPKKKKKFSHNEEEENNSFMEVDATPVSEKKKKKKKKSMVKEDLD